jgi:hypothetical protein
MNCLRAFSSDRRGGTFENFALLAAVVAFVSMVAADLLERFTKPNAQNLAVTAHQNGPWPKSEPLPNGQTGSIDYTATSSISVLQQRSVLSPAGDKAK